MNRLLALPLFVALLLSAARGADETEGDTPAAARQIVLQDPRITESSGLAHSRLDRDLFWTHNDSGDTARLFAVTRSGSTRFVLTLTDVKPIDWEALASVTLDDTPYLLVADTGDNPFSPKRTSYQLHLVREPAIPSTADAVTKQAPSHSAAPDATIRFTYEDGPHDCEAVAVYETTVYLLTKDLNATAGLYALPLPELPVADDEMPEAVARRAGRVPVSLPTGMDIHPDGRRLAVVNYVSAWQFTRDENQTWPDAVTTRPARVSVPALPQIEAVAYDGEGLVVTSEEKNETPTSQNIPSHQGMQ